MGIPTLIKTLTASGDSSLAFVDGSASVVFDSTYDEYMFVCTDINPATDHKHFQFQVNATDDAGGGYDTSLITSTFFDSYQSAVAINADVDLAQSANYCPIMRDIGNGADESGNCILHIFSPSNTTYVKQFYSRASSHQSEGNVQGYFVSGYINDTTAIDEISFKVASGNFDGVIQMYGIA